MKKAISIMIMLSLFFSSFIFADAAAGSSASKPSDYGLKYYTDPEEAADLLYSLSLFEGTGTEADGSPRYNLEGSANREQAITMLIRLLGKEDLAAIKNYSSPFEDVSEWAKPYVGYAYEFKLTDGTSPTTFSGSKQATAAQYVTFVLRALGYDDSKQDFSWSSPWLLSDHIGVTSDEYRDGSSAEFLRSNMVLISANALSVKLKGSSELLYEKLVKEGAIIKRSIPGKKEESKDSSKKKEETDSKAPELSTVRIEGESIDLVKFHMKGRQAMMTLAGDHLSSLMDYKDHIEKAKEALGGTPVISFTGADFNDSYSEKKTLSFPKNCPNIKGTLVYDGRLVAGGSSKSQMMLGFTQTGKALLGSVSFRPELEIDGFIYSVDGVNCFVEDDYATMVFTSDLGVPVDVPEKAKVMMVRDGMIMYIKNGGTITVPEESYIVVFMPTAYERVNRWGNITPGMSISYNVIIEADDEEEQPYWESVSFALSGSPTLVKDGSNVCWYAYGEDTETVVQRTFAAYMGDGRLMIGSGIVSADALAEYLVSKGATDAICLESGKLCVLDASGKKLSTSQSKLSNMIHIY